MKIKGKCKKDFKKWYKKQNFRLPYSTRKYSGDGLSFKDISKSMQYSVYVDFFDSVSMNLYIKPVPTLKELKGRFGVYIDDFGHHLLSEYIYRDTRQEARCVIIEKANEIYNENKDNN